MKMEILLVRHGQSVADIEKRHEGRADYELTDLGVRQANALAAWISENYSIDQIISSPLKRAAKTAMLIGKAIGNEPVYEQQLMEWDNGLLAGLLREEATQRYPMPIHRGAPMENRGEQKSNPISK